MWTPRRVSCQWAMSMVEMFDALARQCPHSVQQGKVELSPNLVSRYKRRHTVICSLAKKGDGAGVTACVEVDRGPNTKFAGSRMDDLTHCLNVRRPKLVALCVQKEPLAV